MTQQQLIPTNGKCPEGLEDGDFVWIQFKDGSIDCRRVISCYWGKYYTDNGSRTTLSNPVVAYCKAETPEPYAPEPDYSKWVGCLCRFNDIPVTEASFTSVRMVLKEVTPEGKFRDDAGFLYKYCCPLTPDEVREYLKKAEEAHVK